MEEVQYEQVEELPRAERLRILLHLIDAKRQDRRILHFRTMVILAMLLLLCFALVAVGFWFIDQLPQRPSEQISYPKSVAIKGQPSEPTSERAPTRVLYPKPLLALMGLAPIAITFLHYFWITFAQIFYRGLAGIERLLESEAFREFKRHVHLELLVDDCSFLSLFMSLFVVELGITSALFLIGALAILAGPVLILVLTSAGVVWLVGPTTLQGLGLGVIYLVLFILAATKSWRLLHAVKPRGHSG